MSSGHIHALVVVICLSIVGGIVLTRLWVGKREKELLLERLARWLPVRASKPMVLIKSTNVHPLERTLLPMLGQFGVLLGRCGLGGHLLKFLWLLAVLFVLPILLAFAIGLNLVIAACAGLGLALVPLVSLVFVSSARCIKFSEQLPDAIDLMISVLRSGHSIPHAVKAVADELPAPCGLEFGEIMQKLNLGQSLTGALFSSAERFKSSELDLIRRAVAIQGEVGGSLAELLDKTNLTLRQRLKLARQVRVLTAQSRLTAIIVGLLPFILAVALEAMSPGYLSPLLNTSLGKMLLVLAVVLQGLGLFLMKRLSTLKV